MPLDRYYVSRFAEVADVTWDQIYAGDPEAIERAVAFGRPAGAYVAPASILIRSRTLPGPHGPVPIRTYCPTEFGAPDAALVWIHGGAFKFGDLDMLEAHAVAAELAQRGNAFVASVDYRLAPEHRYPVQLDDCRTVLSWIRTEVAGEITGPRVWAGGASAGAVLATTLALAERDAGQAIHGLLLAYPGMHLKMPAPSSELSSKVELLPPLARFDDPRAREVHYRDYLGPLFDDPPPNAIPSLADLRCLPRVVMAMAEYDDLRSSGEAFGRLLESAGVELTSWTEPGSAHGYLNAFGAVAAASRTLDAFAQYLRT